MTRMRLAILILSGLCAGTQTGLADGYDPDRFAHNRVEPQPLAVQESEEATAKETSATGEAGIQDSKQASLPAAAGPASAKAETQPTRRSARGIAVPNERLRTLMERHARENGIPVTLVEAVARVESRFNPAARNGPYTGLMQIHPRTAAGVGYRGSQSGLFDPDTNLRYGVRYLAQAYRLAGGDTCGTIMRYQSGHGAKRINAANLAYCAKVRQHIASR